MSEKSKKKKEMGQEIWGLVSFASGLLIFASLVSYGPEDRHSTLFLPVPMLITLPALWFSSV